MFGLHYGCRTMLYKILYSWIWGQTQNDRGSEQPRKEIINVKFAADREKNEYYAYYTCASSLNQQSIDLLR